uniref:NAD-dependent epimerase/dehydratase domain-containing protein n=1 Tax=Chenopodium quinoa TaxID=63459 RepID=A0A803N8J6_CHEQI
MKKNKVLVTGASGFLGGKLCHALLNDGYSVRAFVRHSSNLSSLPSTSSSAHFDLSFGDTTDIVSLINAVSGCDIVIHSAALVEPWLPDPSRFFTNVIQACKESESVQKIIYTSSFFALGPTDGGVIADENQVHHEKFFCTEYERSKVAADKIALQAASEGVPIVAVYPGVIYGSGKLTAGNVVAKLIFVYANASLIVLDLGFATASYCSYILVTAVMCDHLYSFNASLFYQLLLELSSV